MIKNLDIFRHIHVLFRSHILCYVLLSCFVAYVEPGVTLAYSEPCHIQNSGIYGTQDILRTLSTQILAYSERCVTLTQWEPCHIQNFAIFRILSYFRPEAYAESCLFKHIQAYSDIFNNDNLHVENISSEKVV